MKKVFVFCIGGTGIRVMKSITMLMAGGMDTNGYMVVPVIIDPHLDLEEKKNLHSLLDSYINIYQQSINNGTSTLNHLDGFFNSEIRLLSQLNNQSNDTQQVVGSKEKFSSYINTTSLSANDINNFFIETLFSNKKVNKNIESVQKRKGFYGTYEGKEYDNTVTINMGDTVTYRVYVYNNSNSTINDINLYDRLPIASYDIVESITYKKRK